MSYSCVVNKKLSTKWFSKWAKKAGLSNINMLEAIGNLKAGLSVAYLGSHLYKVRIKRSQSGKSSGFRTIIVYNKNDRAIFLYGFAKNERDNIDKTELKYFKKLGNDLLSLNLDQLKDAIEQNILLDLEAEK